VNIVARSFARDSFARALSAEAFVRAMLDFERALAEAEADAGVIPAEAARVIAKACADLRPVPDELAGARAVSRLSDHARRHASVVMLGRPAALS